MTSPRKVAYVFHKGLTEPIPRLHGLDQVRALSRRRRFVVVSFEPRWHDRTPEDRRRYEDTAKWLAEAGVEHVALPLLGSRWLDIPMGAAALLFLVVFRGVRAIHCRSYIPAFMGMLVRALTPTRLLFDMRGLFVDEYMFYGAFREGTWRLAFARWLERRALFASDAVVVVSERFKTHLLARPDLAGRLRPELLCVIPNRVDLGRFDFGRDDRRAERERRGWDDAVVGIFVGSTSPWHRADRAVAIAARVMAELPDVRFVAAVYPTAVHVAGMAEEAELPGDRCEFTTEDVDDVPRLLTAADFAFMLIERHVSKEVCAPIKFSEYMAAGLPVVASRAIGDISGWIEEGGLGVAIDHDDVEAAAGLVTEFLRSDDFRGGAARTRCLDFAAKELNMEQTLSDYEKLYEDLDIR